MAEQHVHVSVKMYMSVSELNIIVSDPTCVMTRCPCVCLGPVKSVVKTCGSHDGWRVSVIDVHLTPKNTLS